MKGSSLIIKESDVLAYRGGLAGTVIFPDPVKSPFFQDSVLNVADGFFAALALFASNR
jgi:hypothetical protein